MPEPTLRFAIGDPAGLSSNSWRVWVKPDGDVYIACRDNYRELKVSLHGDRWRVGLTSEAAGATSHLHPPDADRTWATWDRPAPVDGITMGYRILFLASELAVTPDLRSTRLWRSVEFFPGATVGGVTIAAITINEPGRRMAVGMDGRLLDEQRYRFLSIPTGGQVQLTVHSEPLGEDFRRSLAAAYTQGRALTAAGGYEPPATGRMFLAGEYGGSHFAAEVNFHRPDPDSLRLAE